VPGIIWLASFPKSGNTWMRAFLANYLMDPSEPVDINDLRFHCYGDGFWLHLEKLSGRKKDDLTPEDVAKLRPRLHAWFANSQNHDVFVKTHNIIGKLHGTPLITPSATAGAIYIVRNPLDVAVSFAHHYQVSYARAAQLLGEPKNHVPRSEEQAAMLLGSWSQHVRSWTEAKGMSRCLVRYEDMVRTPEAAFGRVLEFLRVPFESARLAKAIEFSSFEKLSGQEKSGGFREARPDGSTSFFRSGAVGQWAEELEQEQIERICKDQREVMQVLGYITPEGDPLETPRPCASD